MEHRYVLEPYKGMNTRYECPGCGGKRVFARYVDRETGEHIHTTVGRCNRESNCNYHYKPKQYFQDNRISFEAPPQIDYRKRQQAPPQPKHVSLIPVEVFKQTLKGYESNNFAQFLIETFAAEVASQLIGRYFIGSSKHWSGANVFWQIDSRGKIRTGKIMLYNASTGRRIKEPFNHLNWAHKTIEQPEFVLEQCLFGEHLMHDKSKPVAIVESEKTAIIASVYLPQFIWMATGGLSNINAEKFNVLKGRSVTLFPDLNGFEKWSNKLKELSHITAFTLSDLLERKATEEERKQGLDLADYLLKFDYREFAAPQPEQVIIDQAQVKDRKEDFITVINETEVKKEFLDNYARAREESVKFETWEHDITELENYFNTSSLPCVPVLLNEWSTITNIPLFIDSHLSTVKANNGKAAFLPYLHRLQELKAILN